VRRSSNIGLAWAGALALALLVVALPGPKSGSEVAPAEQASGAEAIPAPVRAVPPEAPVRMSGASGTSSAALDPEERDRQREQWRLVKERAEHTLREYRLATRYPPESRPASEHPDQMEIASPERRLPMEGDADSEGALSVVLHQDRVFVAGEEAVTFTVRCEDRRGTPQRCEVPPGNASEPEHVAGSAPLAPVAVPFNDQGREGDLAAGDGTHTARFSPGRSGFLAASGTVRVAVAVIAGSVRKDAFFDVLYTGLPPAVFTGTVRDSVEQGALQLDVAMQVKKPGRYVVTGRVDDATGKQFAWVQFNEELPAGAQQARLTVFGKLLVDEKPQFPLTLRDVEGFLLLEQGDPDRELMPTKAGAVHQTRRHPLSAFSSEEWSSEQRARYLEELQRDVDRADEALSQLSGG